MSVQQGAPGVGPAGQGGMLAAGGPGGSGDKPVHVRIKDILFFTCVLCCDNRILFPTFSWH